jgi:hypothetical protein
LLTGRPIYEPCQALPDFLQRILNYEPLPLRAPPPELPPALVAALNRALARQPTERYADVGEMWQTIRAAV